MSSSWSTDQHDELKHLVTSVKSGISPLTTHTEIEVQERAFELVQLLSFIEADLRNHQPPKSSGSKIDIPPVEGGFEADGTDENDGHADANPPYPKSLFLLQPLFTGYELNAVAPHAQYAVPIPEGLDLDHDFVPGGGFPADLDRDEEEEESGEEEKPGALDLGTGGGKGMEELRRVLREQDKEDKERRKGKKVKGKGKKVEGEVISPEERAEKERVSAWPVNLEFVLETRSGTWRNSR